MRGDCRGWTGDGSVRAEGNEGEVGMNRGDWVTTRLGRIAFRRRRFLLLLALTAAGFAPAPVRADAVVQSMPKLVATQVGADQTTLPSLKLVSDLQAPGPVSGVIWSSDGSKLAAYSADGGRAGILGIVYLADPNSSLIMIWNADGTVFRELRRPRPFIETRETFAFAAGDQQIAAPPPLDSNDLALSIFDIATGVVVHDIPSNRPNRDRVTNGAKILVASPDQSILAVAFGDKDTQPVALYSTKNWKKLGDLPDGPKDFGEHALAFSRDGKFLGVCQDGGVVLIYDVSSRKVVQRINAFPDTYGGDSVTFSPDGSIIAVGSPAAGAGDENPVRLFNTKDASPVAVYPEPAHWIKTLDWSPDTRVLAFITDHRVLHLWDPFQPKTTERRTDLDRDSDSLAFSPDGRKLA